MAVPRYVTVTRTVGGVPLDVDSATLNSRTDGDPSGAAITRIRDGATIVTAAQANAVLHTALGSYSYDYAAHNLDASESYFINFRFVIGGAPQIVRETIQAAYDARTTRGYRRFLYRSGKLGAWGLHTVSAASTTSTAARELLTDELIDKDSDISTGLHSSEYVLMTQGLLLGQQRRVVKAGYTASEGRLLLNRDFDNSAVAQAGDTFERLGRLPWKDQDGNIGLLTLVNRALEAITVPGRVTLTAVTDQYHYGLLDDYPWLLREDQVGTIFDYQSGSLRTPDIHVGGAWYRADFSSPQLEVATPFTATQNPTLEVARPASTWIRSGGAWGDSTVGLVDDDDMALVPPLLLSEVALAFIYEHLAGIDPDDATWERKAALQHRKAARLKNRLTQRIGSTNRATNNPRLARGSSSSRGTYARTWRR